MAIYTWRACSREQTRKPCTNIAVMLGAESSDGRTHFRKNHMHLLLTPARAHSRTHPALPYSHHAHTHAQTQHHVRAQTHTYHATQLRQCLVVGEFGNTLDARSFRVPVKLCRTLASHAACHVRPVYWNQRARELIPLTPRWLSHTS